MCRKGPGQLARDRSSLVVSAERHSRSHISPLLSLSLAFLPLHSTERHPAPRGAQAGDCQVRFRRQRREDQLQGRDGEFFRRHSPCSPFSRSPLSPFAHTTSTSPPPNNPLSLKTRWASSASCSSSSLPARASSRSSGSTSATASDSLSRGRRWIFFEEFREGPRKPRPFCHSVF